ncbi:MAG: hypothetical protein NTU66_02065 [Elusimicrobia bacterium]|nr:hypothetical protein [Elusimicrobiota bacterium]
MNQLKKHLCAIAIISVLSVSCFSGESTDRAMITRDTFIAALATHFGLNDSELNNLSRRGYGRNELITLILISKKSSVQLKEIIMQRDRDAKLADLCGRYGISYDNILSESISQRQTIDDQLSNTHP